MIYIVCHRIRETLKYELLQIPVSFPPTTNMSAFIMPTLPHFYEGMDSLSS